MFLCYESINSSEKRLFHEQCTNFSYPPQHLSFTETGVTVCCQMPEDKLSKPLHENFPKYVVESILLVYNI